MKGVNMAELKKNPYVGRKAVKMGEEGDTEDGMPFADAENYAEMVEDAQHGPGVPDFMNDPEAAADAEHGPGIGLKDNKVTNKPTR